MAKLLDENALRAVKTCLDTKVNKSDTVLDITNGITQAIKDKVAANPGTILKYDQYFYVPQYDGDSSVIAKPTYYNCFEGDSGNFRYLVIDWDEMTIDDLTENYLRSHQSIKTLNTDNTSAQSTSASEAIAGSGTINLHKVAKTGTYSDLIGTPSSLPANGGNADTVDNKHASDFLSVNGGTLNGSLEIFSTGSSWNEGIRIHPASNDWSGVVFCEKSNSGSSASSTNTWSIHNHEGLFGLYKNGSSSSSADQYLCNEGGTWTLKGSSKNGTIALTSDINNGTLTIQANGVSKGTFTANQSGNTTINITAADLGLSSAMHFLGTTTSSISDGSTTNPVTIGGNSVTASAGDVVLSGHKEFVWTGSAWEILGDEGSYALNSVQVIAGTGLSGGGAISGNVTLNHSNSVTAQSTQALYPITYDAQGHITGAGSAVTSLPASDVYSWAKASSKPSYNFSEINPGNITMGENHYFLYRAVEQYRAGFYYSSPGAEAAVFANKYPHASWIFSDTVDPVNKTDWRNLTGTVAMQIRDKSVAINKMWGNEDTPGYNLDVNGSANATTLYENGNRVITSANIGSQSVSSASTATTAEGLSSNGMSVTTAVTSNTSNMTVGSGVTKFKIWNDGRMLIDATMQPWSTQSDINLGTSVNRWNNIYLKGNLSDGSNSTTVSNIVSKLAVANPTLSGGESNLTSIQIGGTNYAIPSGGGTPSNMVTTNTDQTVTGTKTFRTGIIVGDGSSSSCNIQMYDVADGDLSTDGIVLQDYVYYFYDVGGNYIALSASDAEITRYSGSHSYTYTLPDAFGRLALASECGTKLYRHDISLTISGSTTHVYIISTQRAAITGYTGGPPSADIAFSSIVSMFTANSSYMLFCTAVNSTKSTFTVRYLSPTTISGSSYYLQQSVSFTFVSDTVTEL